MVAPVLQYSLSLMSALDAMNAAGLRGIAFAYRDLDDGFASTATAATATAADNGDGVGGAVLAASTAAAAAAAAAAAPLLSAADAERGGD